MWLLAPFLLIAAAAFYWARVEQVSAPGARGMFVSSFQMRDAPGYWREKGYSHEVEVRLSHPWPPPKWWGDMGYIGSQCDPMHPEIPQTLRPGDKLADFMAPGGALTGTRNGRSVRFDAQGEQQIDQIVFEDNQYVIKHHVRLSEVPQAAGAVTFRGLYRIVGRPQIPIERVIRKAGQSLPMSKNKSAGVRLLAVDSTLFEVFTTNGKGGKNTYQDSWRVLFRLQDLASPPSTSETARLIVYDIEIEDEKKQMIREYSTTGFINGTSQAPDELIKALPADEKLAVSALSLEQSLKTTGRLTMRGKISLDYRWPLEFEVKLPRRDRPDLEPSRGDVYPIPLWRSGARVKP